MKNRLNPAGVVFLLLIASMPTGKRFPQSPCTYATNARMYACTSWFALSVLPSVWGWNAVDNFRSIPISS